MFAKRKTVANSRALAPPLFNYQLSIPETWRMLPPDEAVEPHRDRVLTAIDAEARQATTSDLAYERFTAMVGHLHPVMAREPHLALGVWVPDPSSGEIYAGLVLDHLEGEDGLVAEMRDFLPTIGQSRVEGAQAIRTDVERCSFPAGDAVLVVDLEADIEGTLQVTVQFTIFPHACRDALQLSAMTTRLEVEDVLIGETAVFMDHLSLIQPPS